MNIKNLIFSIWLLFLGFPAKSQTKLPYPVIFIHGLNSSSFTWKDFSGFLKNSYGLAEGGRMDFCLNYDGNLNYAYFNTDYKDFTSGNNTLAKGDFYYVNFAVNQTGNIDTSTTFVLSTNESNQQAIFKQGRAIRDAIKYVLNITGKDKVILVGHSMGGLASREYLSNTSIWQSDGKHHVAKLFTNATPHGGSNSSLGSLSAYEGIDEYSEAVRDLRSYYDYLGLIRYGNGVYLFGGVESNSNIYYSPFSNYENVDVNCDGVVGKNVTGVNSKYAPSDIFYTCAFGIGTILTDGEYDVNGNIDAEGDGVVGNLRANMNNYMSYSPPLSFGADTFIVYQFGLSSLEEFHTSLPTYIEPNMRGLDEPNTLDLSYAIDTNKTYLGFITEQSNKKGLGQYDFDCYRINIPAGNKLRVTVTYSGENMNFGIVNSSNDNFEYTISSTKSTIDTSLVLAGYGAYNFYTGFIPYTGQYAYYNFKLSYDPFISIVQQPSSQTICGGNFGTFSVSVAGVGPFTYKWNNGSTNSLLTTSLAGNYLVTVSGLNGTIVSDIVSLHTLNCNTVVAPFIVRQPISQTICGGNFATFIVSVSGTGPFSYHWNNGNTGSSISTSIPGTYFVTVSGLNASTISNGATLTNKNCTVTELSDNVFEESNEINVFPNPVENELTVIAKKYTSGYRFELYNELGVLVLSENPQTEVASIDLRNLSKGFYVLSIVTGNDHRKFKILKK